MDAFWIVAANAGRARLFCQATQADPLEEIGDMVNTAARLRTAETESDSLGQHAASKSRHKVGAPTQPSGYQPNPSPAEHQTEIFARTLAEHLRQAHHQGRFRQLVLMASPEFLGVLRQMLDSTVEAVVHLAINKDYTQSTPGQIREHIRAHEENRSQASGGA